MCHYFKIPLWISFIGGVLQALLIRYSLHNRKLKYFRLAFFVLNIIIIADIVDHNFKDDCNFDIVTINSSVVKDAFVHLFFWSRHVWHHRDWILMNWDCIFIIECLETLLYVTMTMVLFYAYGYMLFGIFLYPFVLIYILLIWGVPKLYQKYCKPTKTNSDLSLTSYPNRNNNSYNTFRDVEIGLNRKEKIQTKVKNQPDDIPSSLIIKVIVLYILLIISGEASILFLIKRNGNNNGEKVSYLQALVNVGIPRSVSDFIHHLKDDHKEILALINVLF